MRHSLGMNEALALTALESGDALSVADVVGRLAGLEIGRAIDDGSVYLALHRMSQRGMVVGTKRGVLSADGRQREVSFYEITPEGRHAVAQFVREANAVSRLARGTA
jgi:DNA-binding PadR family transcriptional regulator